MAVNCPKADCPYSIPEGTDPAVIVALLDAHVKVDHSQAGPMKPKPVDRPLIAAGETSIRRMAIFHDPMEDILQGIQTHRNRPGHPTAGVPGTEPATRPHQNHQGPNTHRGETGSRAPGSHQSHGCGRG